MLREVLKVLVKKIFLKTFFFLKKKKIIFESFFIFLVL